MHRSSKVNGWWIVDRLIAIKALERELSEALAKGDAACGACLQTRVEQLNSWVGSLERALAASQAKSKDLRIVPNRNQSYIRRAPSTLTA